MSGLVRSQASRDGAWQRLQLHAPPGNLLSLDLIRALGKALHDLESTPGIKWLTIEGAGEEFSFGAKIQEHEPGLMATVLPAPTAALVTGRCLGGGVELALACDDILATDAATFGLPEIRLAAFPPVAAALLPLRVGASRATRAVVRDVSIAAFRRGVVARRGGGAIDLAGAGRAGARPGRVRLFEWPAQDARCHGRRAGVDRQTGTKLEEFMNRTVTMIDVDVWVRGAAGAVTQKMKGVSTDVASWTVADVKLLLEQMLKALDRARDPNSEPASVAMRGFSWIVSPDQGGVLVHLELQLGTASAGPFAIDETRLSEMIARVIGGPQESKLVH